jgi:hypothetical protein
MLGVPLRLFWRVDETCAAPFWQLFEIPENTKLLSRPGYLWRKRYEEPLISMEWYSRIFDAFFSNLDRSEFLEHSKRFLASLVPRDDIRVVVNEYVTRVHVNELIGLHVRHTDNIDAYSHWSLNEPGFQPRKISKLEGFKEVVDSCSDKGQSFFLCTDSAEVRADFLQCFPKLHYFPVSFSKEKKLRSTSIRHAVVEMLLLSQCKRIVGTYFSSFSKVAALMGSKEHGEIHGTSLVETSLS